MNSKSEHKASSCFFLLVTPEFVGRSHQEGEARRYCCFHGWAADHTEFHGSGIFKKYGVAVLGTLVDDIVNTEDRQLVDFGFRGRRHMPPKLVNHWGSCNRFDRIFYRFFVM
jgi:hypothetical protein